jgi:hypothetical protein
VRPQPESVLGLIVDEPTTNAQAYAASTVRRPVPTPNTGHNLGRMKEASILHWDGEWSRSPLSGTNVSRLPLTALLRFENDDLWGNDVRLTHRETLFPRRSHSAPTFPPTHLLKCKPSVWLAVCFFVCLILVHQESQLPRDGQGEGKEFCHRSSAQRRSLRRARQSPSPQWLPLDLTEKCLLLSAAIRMQPLSTSSTTPVQSTEHQLFRANGPNTAVLQRRA